MAGKGYIRKGLRILLWIFLGLVGLLIIMVIALQLPPVQNFLTGKATAYLSKKTGAKVKIGEINLSFPKSLYLGDVFIGDRKGDTIWFSRSIKANMDMMALFRHRIIVNDLEINTVTAHVSRRLPDSSFNFSFIINSFTDTTKKQIKPDPNKKGWEFALLGLQLDNIYSTYKDDVTGIDAVSRIGHFRTDLDKFSLEEKSFKVNEVQLANSFASIIQTKPSPPDTTAPTPIAYKVELGKLGLEKLRFVYWDKFSGQYLESNIGTAAVVMDKLDLPNNLISLNTLQLNNSNAIVRIDKHITPDTVAKEAQKAVTAGPKEKAGNNWQVKAADIQLSNNNFRFDNDNQKPFPRGIDYSHLDITGIAMKISELIYTTNRTTASIHNISLQEKSGLVLRRFQGNLVYDSVHSVLSNLIAETNNSTIAKYIEVSYPSLEEISKNPGAMGIKADIDKSTIGYRDVLIFAPDLRKQPPFIKEPNGNAVIDAELEGKLNDLAVQHFALTTGKATVIRASGHIIGIPDVDKIYMDLKFPQLSTTQGDVYAMLPASYLPSAIRLPRYVNASGDLKGKAKDFNTNVNASTSMGSAIAHLHLTDIGGKEQYAYSGSINTPSFQLGQLLKQDSTLGKVIANVSFNGQGFDPRIMQTHLKADVKEIVLYKYPYSYLKAEGDIHDGLFTGTATINDSNIAFAYEGTIAIVPDKAIYNFKLKVDGVDLQALNLTEKDIRVKGVMQADIKGASLNDINGTLNIHDVMFVKDDKQYPIQSLAVVSIMKKGNTNIDINSDFLRGNFKGTINLADLPTELEYHLGRYFHLNNLKERTNAPPQNFTFNLDLYRTDIITDILYPDLQKIIPGTIKGHYRSDKSDLGIDITIPQVVYLGIEVDTLDLKVRSDEQHLDFTLLFDRVAYAGYSVANASLSAQIQHDSILSEFGVVDKDKKQKYLLAANLKYADNVYMLRFRKDGAIFNYEQWSVPSDNFIRFRKGAFVHNLKFVSGDKYLMAATENESGLNQPVIVSFHNFDLLYLLSFVEGNNYPLAGRLNGRLELRNLQAKPAFLSDITINQFSIKQNPVGDVRIIADNITVGRYTADLRVTGNDNDLKAKGYYAVGNTAHALNFNFDVNRLSMKTVEPFTLGQLRDMSGSMDGNFQLLGSTSAPTIIGKFNFHETGFTLSYLNTHYTLHNESLMLDGQGIAFNNVHVADSANHTAEINGYVYTKYFTNYRFSLDVRTDRFLALNSRATKDALYYGKLVVSSRAKIGGDMNYPVIEVTARLTDGTDFTFVMPSEDPSIELRKGVVEFVDSANPPNPIVFRKKHADSATKVELQGISLSSNIEVDEKAKLKIIVDPEAGDYLDVRGKGTMSYGIDQGGNMSLTGRYEITEGSYQLSFYNFVKRKFEIQQGSSITWLGTPLSANLDITAIYKTKASVLPLMEQEVASLGDAEKNQYRQRLNFNVNMQMTGSLQKPTLNMSIDQPENEKGALNGTVANKLAQVNQDPSDVNKQVFGLLTLGSFVREDPFSAGAGGSTGGFSSAAATSLSELMSQQLNSLASKYVKDVELNFNLENYQDYSSGTGSQRTDLKVGVKKEFLNDRLTVNLGSNVNVQGDQQTSTESRPSEIVSDVTIEYKLTKDGRLRLMLFRNNQYEGVIEGQLIETGTGLIFVRDFNKFKQLFAKPEDHIRVREEKEKK